MTDNTDSATDLKDSDSEDPNGSEAERNETEAGTPDSDAGASEAGTQDAGETAAESGEDRSDAAVAAEVRGFDDSAIVEVCKRAHERDLFRDELLRARADYENLQKRTRRDRPTWENHAVRRVLGSFLPTIDNFELALASVETSDVATVKQGIEMIYQMLKATVEDIGVEEIGGEGELFDPELHEAVVSVPSADHDEGEIIDVQQQGYSYKGVVIRPSRVRVAQPVEDSERGDDYENDDSFSDEDEDLGIADFE